MRRSSVERCAEILVEVVFLALGTIGLFLGWNVWLCIILLLIGGALVWIDNDNGVDFSPFD